MGAVKILSLFAWLSLNGVGLIVYPAQSQLFAGGGGGGSSNAGHAFMSSLDALSGRQRNKPSTSGQQADAQPATNLEAPYPFQPHPFVQGPVSVDLLAFNRHKYEQDHQHSFHGSSDTELRRGEMIEANLMAIPERLLSQLPEDVNKQIFETLSTDPTLMMGAAMVGGAGKVAGVGSLATPLESEDPDGASIARLTKSCMTVHASSALPEQLNVTFHLYTKKNPQVPFLVWPQITRFDLLKGSPFEPTKPIKWITHGFHTNIDKSEWMLETKDKILAFEDANVFLTDWRRGSSPALAFYPKAAANAHVVAKMIVKILRRLKGDVDFANVHLIGHSLGAHIMGFVGSAFTEEYLHHQQQEMMGRRATREPKFQASSMQLAARMLIGRITACDPALPCFGPSSSGPNSRHGHPAVVQVVQQSSANGSAHLAPLSRSTAGVGSNLLLGEVVTDWTPTMWTHLRPDSAIVVEVMHSNPGVMGYADPLGDYDFYPNGFERQPGCGNQQRDNKVDKRQSRSRSIERTKRQATGGGGLMGTLDRFIKPLRDFVHGYTCSHHRSVEYMVESMYYERVPQDRKLDREQVCQMVGYRCPDYASFKRGFCFRCQNDFDCRTFLMPTSSMHQPPASAAGRLSRRDQRNSLPSGSMLIGQGLLKFRRAPMGGAGHNITNLEEIISESSSPMARETTNHDNNNNNNNNSTQTIHKRVLPTYNPYESNYRPLKRNQYYFDTKPNKEYCLHHYHLFVKYRWFRVRESVSLDGFVLSGLLGNIIVDSPITLNRFTYQSYTLLMTHHTFLGQLDALTIFGDKIKPTLVEYIEITYMSNSDPRIRSLGSARLCRSQTPQPATSGSVMAATDAFMMSGLQATTFSRCAGSMV